MAADTESLSPTCLESFHFFSSFLPNLSKNYTTTRVEFARLLPIYLEQSTQRLCLSHQLNILGGFTHIRTRVVNWLLSFFVFFFFVFFKKTKKINNKRKTKKKAIFKAYSCQLLPAFANITNAAMCTNKCTTGAAIHHTCGKERRNHRVDLRDERRVSRT